MHTDGATEAAKNGLSAASEEELQQNLLCSQHSDGSSVTRLRTAHGHLKIVTYVHQIFSSPSVFSRALKPQHTGVGIDRGLDNGGTGKGGAVPPGASPAE